MLRSRQDHLFNTTPGPSYRRVCQRREIYEEDSVGKVVEQLQLVRSLERSRAKSLAFDPNGDVSELDPASLKSEQQQIYERLSTGPRDWSRELSQLRAEADQIQVAVSRERWIAVDAESNSPRWALSPRLGASGKSTSFGTASKTLAN